MLWAMTSTLSIQTKNSDWIGEVKNCNSQNLSQEFFLLNQINKSRLLDDNLTLEQQQTFQKIFPESIYELF